jgi:hypothetical protein
MYHHILHLATLSLVYYYSQRIASIDHVVRPHAMGEFLVIADHWGVILRSLTTSQPSRAVARRLG